MAPQTGLQKSIKNGSKNVLFLNLHLSWFLVKMGPPKWKVFQHKTSKNMIFRAVRIRSRIQSDFVSIFKEFGALSKHENIEKTLVFAVFFENHPSSYKLHFRLTFGPPNPAIWDPKNRQKPLQERPQRVPETGSFFDRFLCWFLLVFGPQNGLQNQHKIN